MKLTCDFCGGYLSELDETCPHCGATNSQYKRTSSETPRTIEELKQWYIDHHLPPQDVTRFYIGVDYKYPRAFGIYQDGERFIVYKNKEDGSRAIRYDGADEAYAVNELYMKLKERIAQEKAKSRKSTGTASKKKRDYSSLISFGITAFILLIAIIIAINEPNKGYYSYGGEQYYYLDDDWYWYDSDYNCWSRTSVDQELKENYESYYESDSYDSGYGTSDFSNTGYYSEWESSSWDNDSSWSSSDSWDSGGGDWSSDW